MDTEKANKKYAQQTHDSKYFQVFMNIFNYFAIYVVDVMDVMDK